MSDEENENNTDIDPIEVTIAAGATLSSPARASISRKRKIHVNEGKYKQRGSSSSTSSSGKGNTTCAWDLVKDYPKQHFAVVSGNLRCNACSETLSLKKSSIDKHIKSSKHTNGVARIAKDKKQSQSIMDCLKRRDMREHPSGSTLPAEIRLFRFEIVECVISGGIPLSKVDILRPLLEKCGHRLTHSANLREIIPAVLEKEREKLLSELESVKEASVIFDGTARMGEALAIIVRFVQRLIRLEVLAKALKGDELAQRLMSCLAVKHNFGPNTIIGGIRDGASVNGAALRQLKFFYSNLFDVVCFSHTIDNVGNHFEFRILDSFIQYWVSLFAHSFNARLLWKEKTGQAMRTHSDTRWWSNWEILQQAFCYFGDIEPFLRENEEMSPAMRRHLLEIFDDHQDAQDLRLELAAVVDAGVHFVSATYYLEGDTPLICSCYERLCSVAHAVAVEHYPNTTAVAREIAGGNAVTYNQLMTQAKACIQPGLLSRNLAFNFVLQSVLLRLHGCVVLCKYKISTQRLPPWKNSETFQVLTMTILLPTWPESYLTILLQLMVLSWQMKKKSWHGGQPTVTHFHIGQV